jgi:hypothetical protein
MYPIKLTPLAVGFAFKVGGEEALIEWARKELAEVVGGGCATHDNGCPDLIFHTLIPTGPDGKSDWDGQHFICTQDEIEGQPGIVVDTATPEESEGKLEEGPFKGFKIVIPSPDT